MGAGISSSRGKAFLVVLFAVLVSVQPGSAQVFFDDFNDSVVDTTRWQSLSLGFGPVVAEVNQRVEVTLPANSSGSWFGAALLGVCKLTGDFDMQVDYELLDWPAINGTRVHLATFTGCPLNSSNVSLVQRVSFVSSEFPGNPREVYLTLFSDGVQAITGTSDTSGKLRLVRSGTTVTGYYMSGSSWVALRSALVTASDLGISIQAQAGDSYFADQLVKVAFDNFTINQGQLRCPQYEFIGKWGTPGGSSGQLGRPGGMALDSAGNIYVADVYNHRVQKFDPNGGFLGAWGSYGSLDGEFIYPQDVAVDASGNVYVVEWGNNRVQKFGPSGGFLTKWGSAGSTNEQFNGPRGIAVDPSGNVYVADAGNGRIQKFNPDGVFLAKFGSPGSADGQFGSPFGVGIDAAGNIIAADSGNHRIQKLGPDGRFIRKWGTLGTGSSQFNYPTRAEVDKADNIYVADRTNNRVQKFDPDGNFITEFGCPGTGDSQFNEIYGLTVRKGNLVYVADHQNNRIQKFTIKPPFLDLDPPSLDFRTVAIDNSAALTAKVSNLGLLDLNVTGISRCGGTSTEFSWTPAPPFTVAPGQFANLSVIYAPFNAGTDTGCLDIASNDPGAGDPLLNVTGAGRYLVVTPSSTGNGTIEPSTPQEVAYDGTASITMTPAAGYHIETVTGTCGGALNGTTYTTLPVRTDCTVEVTFGNTFVVTPSSGPNGSLSPSVPQTVVLDDTTSFTVIPNTGYHIASVTGCGGTLTGNTYTTGPITADCTVRATFAANIYPLTVTAAGSGSGTVNANGLNCSEDTCTGSYPHGTTVIITAAAQTGSLLDNWSGCLSISGRKCTVTLIGETAVTATFSAITMGGFADVPADFWADDFIYAVYQKGITTGCTQTPLNYCPGNDVTRQAMAAFIIRALEGEPPLNYCDGGSPFTDVPPDNQFCRYIKRMKERAITLGCNPPANDRYCPTGTVTRQAMAAFIIRSLYGETFVYELSPHFTDVPASHVFFKYVQKMKEEAITTGCDPDRYCPTNNVRRDQMAAFLARAFLGMP